MSITAELLNLMFPDFVAYDIETTGLNPSQDNIVEITAVRVQSGRVTGIFYELINPGVAIPREIADFIAITDGMVAKCAGIEDVLPRFMSFVGVLPMVAHNAEFTYKFIKEKFERQYGKEFQHQHYCTMKRYREYYCDKYGTQPTNSQLANAVNEILGEEYYNQFSLRRAEILTETMAVKDIFQVIGAG